MRPPDVMASSTFYEEGSKLLTPGAFAFVLDSDGGWDTDWATGHQPASADAPGSPRNLVGMLFEPYSNDSPFTDITGFLTRHR